jgi:hypothetical protein
MPEDNAPKAAADGGNKNSRTVWDFFTGIFDAIWSGPVTKTLLIGGFILLVFFALGGIPKVETLTSSQSRNVLFLGVLAIASSVAMQLVHSGRFQDKSGRFHRVFPFLMLATGIFSIGMAMVFLFGTIKLPQSEAFRADLDLVVICLALASWCGFAPAYLSARRLEAIPPKIKEQVDTHVDALTQQHGVLLAAMQEMQNENARFLQGVPQRIDVELKRLNEGEADFLKHLKESESRLVNHVEDATRSMLKGFDEVFARAFSMIKNAEDELILVNSAMNFGSPHKYNPAIVQKYAEHNKGANFENDVGTFFSQLKGKIVSLPSVQILTVSQQGAMNNFLAPLSERAGYDKLQQAFSIELAALNKTSAEIAAMVERESSDCADGRAPKCMLEAESLPIQLLITGLPPNGGYSRSACLVFMVGTEMLQSGLVPGSEPAFYTELDNMVVVFKRLALALIEAARANARQARSRR